MTTSYNVVLAGGWAGLWRSADHGDSWAQISTTSPTSNFDFSLAKGDVKQLQRMKWHGVHQILIDEYVWVVSYVSDTYTGSKNKGIWRGSDLGAAFPSTALMDSTLRRGVAVDSCNRRVHITSGAPHTGGTNDSDELDHASGKLTCRLTAAGNFFYDSCKVDASGPDYRYRFGGAVVANGSHNYVYVSVPGHGLMRQTLATEGPTCEYEFHGGGDDMSARRVREEGPAPAIAPTIFTLKDAYDRELYDLSGRKVRVTMPGVYFERRLLPGGATRHTVIVTP